MARNRVKVTPAEDSTYYHCTGRVNAQEFLFNTPEIKEKVVKTLKEVAAKFHCEILDYIVVENHYHIVISIKSPKALKAKDWLKFYQLLVNKKATALPLPSSTDEQGELERFQEKVVDLSKIIGSFQQRVAEWYNRTFNRTGRLWQGRFFSEVIEDISVLPLMAYNTLNSVRAKMVVDPATYRFCGYHERIMGTMGENDAHLLQISAMNLAGNINAFLNSSNPREDFKLAFRAYLMGMPLKKGGAWDSKSVGEYLEEHGGKRELTWRAEYMIKCAHVGKSVAIGSKTFVAKILQKFSGHYGYKRPHDPHPPSAPGFLGDLHTFKPIRPPVTT